jgi:DNA-binding NtrC family response regulator
VVATHQDLDRLVRDGRFRADLFYRIQGATVVLPALRERREDVAPLAEHLLSILGQRFGRPGARLTPAAVSRLEAQSWPGNVRQLQHALESSLALADSDLLDARDLALPDPSSTGGPRAAGEGADARSATEQGAALTDVPTGPGSPPASFKLRVAGFEREVVAEALERCHGNKAAAGRLLGLDENQIRYLCRKHLLG